MVVVIIFLTILFGLLFINMFAGVVIAAFDREQDQIKMNHLMNEVQRHWIQVQNLTYKVKPIRYLRKTGNPIRDLCITIAQWAWFDSIILALIILNSILMCLRWID